MLVKVMNAFYVRVGVRRFVFLSKKWITTLVSNTKMVCLLFSNHFRNTLYSIEYTFEHRGIFVFNILTYDKFDPNPAPSPISVGLQHSFILKILQI